ncbi:MAG: peptidoglycan-associated lipoprotein Pal [Deltaproteobacteria bacterium]|nr:peptidoglycan-associated lipoprotein Pal [Deltaproteobacteria bacterium]
MLYAVHFDFDKYNIREDDKPVLEKNAKWLNLNKKVTVIIEGHADERGETEYNLALGDKRARSVEKYLEALGVSRDRLATISFGEEKPVDPGHDEAAWSKNRRAEFKITSN